MSGALIMPDPLSNIISKDETNKYIVSSYDYLLRSIDIRPSSIIRFGTKPTSKVLNQWLEKNIIVNEIGAMIYNSKEAQKHYLIDAAVFLQPLHILKHVVGHAA